MLSNPEIDCSPELNQHQITPNNIPCPGIGNCKRHSTSVSTFSNVPFDGYCNSIGGCNTTCAHYQKYCKKWYEPLAVPSATAASLSAMGKCCSRFRTDTADVCTCPSYKNHRRNHSMIENHKIPSREYYPIYDRRNRPAEDDDSTFPGLLERDFTSLHRNIPALRRSGIDTSTIRQHFYPDGSWGWIICGLSFLAHVLTSGLQLSYGLLIFYALQHLHNVNNIEWLGALSWSVSMITAAFLATFGRKKSTRLLAVVGGLILPLGTLFTSFATELGQIIFSYGIIIGIGASMVRESSTIMLGSYFKKRRQFVEAVAMSGEGVGIAYFSVILKEGVGKMGWRLGLQMVALMISLSFFMGFLYRPASLYHPQRRAIQHLKNQRKKYLYERCLFFWFIHLKVKEKKLSKVSPFTTRTIKKYILNLLPLKSNTIKILTLSSGIASFGIYTPIFCMSLHIAKEGSDIQDIVLLQTFLGMSIALGTVIAGTFMQRPLKFRNPLISSHIFPQIFLFTMAVALLFFSFVLSYRAISVLCWIFGIGFGGFRYSFKTLVLERVKSKYFNRAWGLIKGVEAIPVLISVPLTIFLNDYSMKYGRAGYYICSAATAIAGILLFFIGYSNTRQSINTDCNADGFPLVRSSRKSGIIGNNYPLETSFHNCLENSNAICCGRTNKKHVSCSCPRNDDKKINHSRQNLYSQFATVHNSPVIQRNFNFEDGNDIAAVFGRRLQRSFSYIQNPCENAIQCLCNCCDSTTPRLKPINYNLRSSKSHSFPEGLSYISQQCNCLRSSIQNFDSHQLTNYDAYMKIEDFNMYHNCGNRPHTLSRPVHLLDQITTSV